MLRVLTFKQILFYAGNKKGRGLSPAAFLNYVFTGLKTHSARRQTGRHPQHTAAGANNLFA